MRLFSLIRVNGFSFEYMWKESCIHPGEEPFLSDKGTYVEEEVWKDAVFILQLTP